VPVAMFESPMDWAIVLLVVLLLFGGRKIPEMMRGLGQGIREFREGMKSEPTPPTPPATSAPAPPANAAPAEQKK